LNVAEYDQTVHDLLQTNIRLSENFPPDDTAYGFDSSRRRSTSPTRAWAGVPAQQFADSTGPIPGPADELTN
jgi:Protein of unknown function (DUF1587)